MRLTRRGRFTAASALALWVLAFLVASPASALAATVCSIALAHALATAPVVSLKVERAFAATRFREGESTTQRLVVTLRSPSRAWMRVEERVTPGVEPASGGEGTAIRRFRRDEPHDLALSWTFETWGMKTFGPLHVVATDPLGLIEVESGSADVARVRVVPRPEKVGKFVSRRVGPQPALGLHSVSRPGDSSEFFALREYQSGDSIRRINWKATARSTATIVNQATQDTFMRVVAIVDLREKELTLPDVRSARTLNGRAAASVLEHHHRHKDHIALLVLTGEPKVLSVGANPRPDDLTAGLAAVEAGGRVSLKTAVEANLALFRPGATVYVMTSAALDEGLPDAVRTLRSLGVRVVVISPEPLAGEDADASAIRQASREWCVKEIRSSGIPFASWRPGSPLEVALHQP